MRVTSATTFQRMMLSRKTICKIPLVWFTYIVVTFGRRSIRGTSMIRIIFTREIFSRIVTAQVTLLLWWWQLKCSNHEILLCINQGNNSTIEQNKFLQISFRKTVLVMHSVLYQLCWWSFWRNGILLFVIAKNVTEPTHM